MAKDWTVSLMDCLRRAVIAGSKPDRTDGQLLEDYLSRRDEEAVIALVRRHGPMVWGVCRRVLHQYHDAEDAFQATFLVLVRKAASIVPRGMVGNWLYGVAHQTALKARTMTAKRQARERQVKDMPEPAASPEPDLWPDLEPLLDQALSRMPDKYRVAIVLCDLEGKTRKEAARQLKIPEGTLSTRLRTARTMLAKRLARCGLAVSGGALAAALSQTAASAGVPASIASSTIKAATLVAAGKAAAAGVISVRVAALTEGIMKAMFLNKLKVAMVVLLTVGLLTFSAGTLFIPTAVGTAAGGEKKKELQPVDSANTGESRAVQVRIAGPVGMTVCVLKATPDQVVPIETPVRLNLESGKRYRLKLAGIPNRPGVERFPTVEIPKADETAEPFATNSAIPIEFTDKDFDQVSDGKAITKVVYLKTKTKGSGPGVWQREPTTIASYDDSPRDVIEEARQGGTILAVVRMGNIDLGAAEPEKDKGRANLLVDTTASKLVKVEIGDDGIQGRVLRADQLQVITRDVATVQAENETLRQKLKQAELEVRSLQTLLDWKEQELKKARAANGK